MLSVEEGEGLRRLRGTKTCYNNKAHAVRYKGMHIIRLIKAFPAHQRRMEVPGTEGRRWGGLRATVAFPDSLLWQYYSR